MKNNLEKDEQNGEDSYFLMLKLTTQSYSNQNNVVLA